MTDDRTQQHEARQEADEQPDRKADEQPDAEAGQEPRPRARRTSGGRPGGRRAGTTRTRDDILQSARELFAERGYPGTTIRAVAAAAGVDPALVHHFFGTKDELFAEALQLPGEIAAAVPALLADGLDGAGERLVRFYLGLWEDPRTRASFESVFRSAVAHEQATQLLRDFVTARLLDAVGSGLLKDQPRLRLSLAMSQLAGLALARYVLAVPPLAEPELDHVVACVAPSVQRFLSGELPAAPAAPPTR